MGVLLTRTRVRTVNRLHRPLSKLTPGQAKKDITALQAKAILESVRPRDLAGKTRRRPAAEQLAKLMAVEKKMKVLTAELKTMVQARGSTLMDLTGVDLSWPRESWPMSATSPGLPTGTGSIWTGTAPLDASSGEQIRHRLSLSRVFITGAKKRMRPTRADADEPGHRGRGQERGLTRPAARPERWPSRHGIAPRHATRQALVTLCTLPLLAGENISNGTVALRVDLVALQEIFRLAVAPSGQTAALSD